MTAAPPAHLLLLDEVGEGDRARAGGKAWGLARLRRAGLPVPDGFVAPAGFADARALDAACAALGGPFAVRSSAAFEDGGEASFAGQFRTELAVPDAAGVQAAIARCRADVESAAGYARAMGSDGGGGMAVLVQRFVEPRAAGVLFTQDPRDATALLVEAHPGRGDALVSGRVTPDRYAVDRATGAVRGGAGATLAAADLAALVTLALRAEAAMGGPQDVEWAIGADGPVLLQSRPITVAAEAATDPRVRRLTRANVGEVLPGPVSPLTATSVLHFLEHGFVTVARAAGLMPDDAPPFLVVHQQHLYLNLTLCRDVAARLPGISPGDAERLVLGGGAPPAHVAARGWWRAPGIAARLGGLARALPARIAEAGRALSGVEAEAASDADRDAAGLMAAWDRLIETGRPVAVTHILASGASAMRLAILSRLIAMTAPGDPADRVNRLTAGLDDVESAAPAIVLEELGEEAAERPEWRAWLEGEPRDLTGAPAALAECLRGFLRRHGHRGVSEGELLARPWSEDPSPVLASLRALARHRGIARAAARDRRLADEAALLSAAGPVRGAALRWAITAAQEGVRRRERTKSLAIRFIARARVLARTTGERLAAQGRLARADDVFFLTLGELRGAVRGATVPAVEIARRRRRHERAGAATVPRDVDLSGAAPAATDDGALAGIPVSAGIAFGPARVLHPGESPALAPGEVLVAPVLDAAYGPLLASCAGAIAEMGGALSHGAVVARELGIPCVVDVRGATSRIRTGQRVRVDGGSGRVEIVEDAGSPALPAIAPADPADETFHVLENHRSARESVYVNAYDPAAGIAIVASAGVRRGGRGEALLAITGPGDGVLFAVDRDAARGLPRAVGVGAFDVALDPLRVSFDGRVASHRGGFPPPPVPALLTPRDVALRLDLAFTPAAPAVDFCAGLPEDLRAAVQSLGAHHVEQSGRWTGTVEIDGRRLAFEGTGSRDHTWGRRDWSAADWWRMFTLRLGDDVALHALAVSARGRVVEGGFLWREGRPEAITRVQFAPDRDDGALRALELEITTAGGEPIRLRGEVERAVTVPVDPDRRPRRWLAGRPWRLLLEENFVRYEGLGRTGYGMAEITIR